MPACSSLEAKQEDVISVYEESLYSAPASITGLPVVVSGGVQWLGKPFAEGSLLAFSKQVK
jgi:hypothetical protein